MAPKKAKPEVMSPAGYWPQMHAAVEAGADSVYFGLKHFSARAKVGFTLAELPEAMRTLHRRGVRGFVTFNTLVFEHELSAAAEAIAAIAAAGADALIVQDLGVCRLAHEIAPDLELHASTQMSITNAEGVRLAQSFGVDRVTLARELSLEEIRAIVSQTDCDLEIFVHGALCVAYSGQCFSSEAWGGRSANRGQCAQACRLPYEMIVDGVLRPLGDARYLLSPGDLYALHQVPEIVEAGVSALKIEGRYKDADYVALATRAYRQAVDAAMAGKKLPIGPVEELQLEQVYSRGLGPFFISGTNHQQVVSGRAPRHRGVCLGRVVSVAADRVTIAPTSANDLSPAKPGDGIVFDAADWRSPDDPEEGGRIYQATPKLDGTWDLSFGNHAVRFARIRVGDLVWRTDDPELEKAVRPFTQAAAPVARQAVCVHVNAHEGKPLVTEWRLESHPGICVTLASEKPLGHAQSRPLTVEGLREQLGRLGNTPYMLRTLDLYVEGEPFVPLSMLNQLRRDAVEKLQEAQGNSRTSLVRSPSDVLQKSLSAVPSASAEPLAAPSIHLLVRTPEQLDAALELSPTTITLDYLDLYGLRPSVERVKSRGIPVRVASPRILKPGEARISNFLSGLNCAILVRSTAVLHALRSQTAYDDDPRELIGDFSLNAANSLTAATYRTLGLSRLAPTHDLNAEQITALAGQVGGDFLEAIAYHHLPVFHTEHCVFCRFLSTGTTYRDCGRPCETHRVELRDKNGRAHPVMADVGCRNTVFGAEAQQASAHLASWLNAGIRHFRLEFVHESAAQVAEVFRAFRAALTGQMTAAELERRLKHVAPQGTTEGSLFVPSDYLNFPILQ